MKKTLNLIIILIVYNSYGQENDFTDLNEKTVYAFLTDGDNTLQSTETNDKGFKIYSSIKNSPNSQLQTKVYFLNGYPIIFETYMKAFLFKNFNVEEINVVNRDIIKSFYEKDKSEFKNFEFLSEKEYTTKSDTINNIVIQHFGSYGEDDKLIFKTQRFSGILNFNKLPFFKGVISNDGEEIKLVNVSTFNIEDMIKYFIKDLKYNIDDFVNNNLDKANKKKALDLINNLDKIQIKATFEEMDDETLAVSYGINNDNNILIKVNPIRWTEASNQKKWYIIYHELGHDVLNFHHGEGDKMMFNFIDKKYTWNDFFDDRKKMFEIYFSKKLLKINDIIKPENNPKKINAAIATVKIGNHDWTTKNLNVSRYRNGDIIPEVKDKNKWAKLTTGAWCYYNNEPKNGDIYGKLYNWYAVNDPRGLAPEGFHIPSIDELDFLTSQDTLSSGKMKDIHLFENSFIKIKGGHLMKSSGFEKRKESIYFWSLSDCEDKFDNAIALSLIFGYNFTTIQPKKYLGLYVRCIKD